MEFGLIVVIALMEAFNDLEDAYRFWLMDNTPYVDVIKGLGFQLWEDGSITIP